MSTIALHGHAVTPTSAPVSDASSSRESTSLAFVAAVFATVLASYGVALFLLR